jgi:type II secretory pathway pseudopilin PulG
MKTRSSQRGASLLESIAFLGIAAIVILGAVALLLGSFSSANTNRTQQEVTSIRTGVKKLFMGQSASYGNGSINPTLISAKVFPTTLAIDTSNNVLNAWNGAVDVAGNSANFTISYANVPKDVCVSLASANGDWIGVEVNSTSLPLPVSPSAAESACNASANTMVWTAN